ncbi:MAG: preprotein translocase subunit Sec61beta [Candidatus Altiarchaeota archaeon]|nr:preprotein translocase subunit Sec61beta [Candidatus Altiarchaeota archaeon]
MPSLQRSSAENPMTGAGIIRYFNEEKGIKIEPMVFIGLTVAFIVLEILLNLV